MKILFVGNGLNETISDSPGKYNVLNSEVESFFKEIGFSYKPPEMNILVPSYNKFEKYISWLGEPSIDKDKANLFNYYNEFGDSNQKIGDLETVVQLYQSSIKYQNLHNSKKKEFQKYILSLKAKVVDKLKNISKMDILNPKTVSKLNSDYDLIITTNYDKNLEFSGVKNVFHAHGTIDDIDSIELATYKTHLGISDRIDDAIINKNVDNLVIDLFGIAFFNEIHILNVLFRLEHKYKDKLKINHYIYSSSQEEYDSKSITNIFLTFTFGVFLGKEIGSGKPYSWTLERKDHFNHLLSNEDPYYMSNEIITRYIWDSGKEASKQNIKNFKYVFNFVKKIRIHPNTNHYISNYNFEDFRAPTIDFEVE